MIDKMTLQDEEEIIYQSKDFVITDESIRTDSMKFPVERVYGFAFKKINIWALGLDNLVYMLIFCAILAFWDPNSSFSNLVSNLDLPGACGVSSYDRVSFWLLDGIRIFLFLDEQKPSCIIG